MKALLRTYWALKSWGLKTSLYATRLLINFDEVAKLQITGIPRFMLLMKGYIKKPWKSRLLSSTKREENRIEL